MQTTQATKLPKGIRQRGNSFQVIVQVNGERKSTTAPTLDAAIEAREHLISVLKGEVVEGHAPGRPAIQQEWTFREAGDYCVEHHWSVNSTEGHTRRQKRHISEFIEFFGEHVKLSVITGEDVDAFIAHQVKEHKITDSTINRKLSTLSKLMNEAMDQNKLKSKPKIRFRRASGGRELAFLNDSDYKHVLAFIERIGEQDFIDWFLVMYGTGFRPNELLTVKARHCDFHLGKHGVINLWGDTVTKKHQRSIPMTKVVSEVIERRLTNLSSDAYVFPFSAYWIRDRWASVRSHMQREDDSEFTPYILRHTCATNLARNGKSAVHIMKWMGHRNIQTSMNYIKLFAVDLFDIVD